MQMNLSKLYETQTILRDRIGYYESDRLEKLTLALLVELGECSNEHRGFKFWSKDQEPRTKRVRNAYIDLEDAEFYNPLLEEYVDCLHFVLEIGIELGIRPTKVGSYRYESVTRQFKEIFWEASCIQKYTPVSDYISLFTRFVGLGEMLGFTWDEIEEAYFKKNKINHQRQETGY